MPSSDTSPSNTSLSVASLPDAVKALLKIAFMHYRHGDLIAAAGLYQEVLERIPGHFGALHMLGVVALQKGDLRHAVSMIEQALTAEPENAGAVEAYSNLAVALVRSERYQDALAAYEKAIHLDPGHADLFYNRGNLLLKMKRDDAALDCYDQALALKPDHAEAHANRGSVLRQLKRYAEAADSLGKAFALNPRQPFLEGLLLHTKMQICDWQDFDLHCAALHQGVRDGQLVTSPFPLVAVIDAPDVQRRAAELWVTNQSPANPDLGPLPRRSRAGKIRLGYFSGDFRNHPVANLTVELFETHHRGFFEVYAFSYGPPTEDPMRKRLDSAFDKFIDVYAMSDRDVAKLARDMKIDIAIDLAGHTTSARTGIFAMRAAPVQVAYIGYPATMGAPYIHYVLADQAAIPPQNQAHYAERIAYLPYFQINSRGREIAHSIPTRGDLGLPETGFVFSSFNNAYKITPHVFAGWMRILKQVPGSSLLLYAENEQALQNLSKQATLSGLEPGRLVFCSKVSMPNYLARYRAVDLFLDTFPYNAGTTASDALWAGLPILTRAGESFASRMGASLLQAVGLPDLIATSQEEFEAKAVMLATHPEYYAGIKEKLVRAREESQLFDVGIFVANVENLYAQMIDLYDADNL